MEEKERYEVRRLNYSLNVKLTDNYEPDWRYIIFDDVNDKEFAKLETVCNLLNQCDKRIKELEEELEEINAGSDFIYEQSGATIKGLIKENLQLKQQLHELPKNILKDIQENFDWKQCCEIRKYYDQQYIWFNYVAFNDFLDTLLKKYGGENE